MLLACVCVFGCSFVWAILLLRRGFWMLYVVDGDGCAFSGYGFHVSVFLVRIVLQVPLSVFYVDGSSCWI